MIDTGADYTVFSRDVASELGIDVEGGQKEILDGAGGHILVYKHALEIKIGKKLIKTKGCFSIRNDIPENVIGRKDMIDNFKIIFSKNNFTLEPYD